MAEKQHKIFITRLSERNKLPSINESKESIVEPVISYLHVNPTGFHNLPIDYLVKTFQYVSSYELQKNIMSVCSHWRYAAKRPELWKRLRICKNETPREYIMQLLRNYTDIEDLHLENLNDLNAIISQACRCLKKLKHLKLRKCSKLSYKSLNYIIKTHEDLETIDLSKTSLEDNNMFSKFGHFTRLKSLNLSHVPGLTIHYLMEAVINCHFLEELKISNIKTPKVYLTDDDAAFIISKISNSLKSLSIDCYSLTNIFFNTLFECSKLTRLCLYGAKNITGDVLQYLWYYLPNLREFKLRNAHHITSDDIESLFSTNTISQSVQQLTLLDLTGCWKLTDKATAIIASNCPKLKFLTLKSCKRLTNLANLATMKQLTQLNIAFCIQLEYVSKDGILLPPKLKKIVIHLDLKSADLIHDIVEGKKPIQIYIAESEFNKSLFKYEF